MPLGRYFLLMGGALLMVLLVAGAYLPSLPVVEQVETRQPKIRIHSDKKLPERVVFDTSMPAVTHPVEPMTAETDPPRARHPPTMSRPRRGRHSHSLQSSDMSKAKLADTKRPELQIFAVAQERNKKTRGSTAQDQACTATSVRLVWRQDVVVRRRRDVSCVSSTQLE